jgi:hypothetical protein
MCARGLLPLDDVIDPILLRHGRSRDQREQRRRRSAELLTFPDSNALLRPRSRILLAPRFMFASIKKKVPKAEELVVRANSLLSGDPTCNQMLEASKLLEQAIDIYENADVPWKEIQKVARRMISLEQLAKVGKCHQ